MTFSESDEVIDTEQLLDDLEATNTLSAIDESILLKARHLYVAKLMPLSQVARQLQLPREHVEQWANMFDWHTLRQEREFKLYQRLTKIRRKFNPNIDVRHDKIFASLEGLIEDTIRRYQESGKIDPDDIRVLVNAMHKIQESRRLIHQKETSRSKRIVELGDNPGLVQTIGQAMASLLPGRNGKAGSNGTIKDSGPKAIDVDYREVVDADDHIDHLDLE